MEPAAPLIVGAGPSGMAAAIAILRMGGTARVVEKSVGRASTSRALGIHARTLELLEPIGLTEAILERGNRIHSTTIYDGSKRLISTSFKGLPSRFPFAVILPQTETEELLEAKLRELGGHIERQLELTALRPERDQVVADLRHTDERIETTMAPWVIGADGAHSTVRHQLNLPFRGSAYPQFFALADVTIENGPAADEISVYFHSDGPAVIFPFGGNRYRVVVELHGDKASEGVSLDELEEALGQRTARRLPLSEATWLSGFRTHHRIVSRYQVGRVLLLGDAAHIHSPAGGQGMNTGIQDGLNLGWKLALHQLGRASERLISTYPAERRPVAQGVLQTTNRMMVAGGFRARWFQALRNQLMVKLSGKAKFCNRLAHHFSQISVHYPHSRLSVNSSPLAKIGSGARPGDRVPEAIFETRAGEKVGTYDLLEKAGFHLFIFQHQLVAGGTTSLVKAQAFAERFRQLTGELGEVHFFTSESHFAALHAREKSAHLDRKNAASIAFGLPQGGALVIRPDGYIGYRSRDYRADSLQRYLQMR